MALPFAGKHCAIVGATGTIGFSMAKAFAAQGAVITLLGRSALSNRSKLEPELTPYQPSRHDAVQGDPASHRFIKLDVSAPDAIQSAFNPKAPDVSDTSCKDVDI